MADFSVASWPSTHHSCQNLAVNRLKNLIVCCARHECGQSHPRLHRLGFPGPVRVESSWRSLVRWLAISEPWEPPTYKSHEEQQAPEGADHTLTRRQIEQHREIK